MDRQMRAWWVRKEAVLKASGVGLDEDPREVEITAPSQPPRLIRWAGSPELFAGGVRIWDLANQHDTHPRLTLV